MISDIRDAMDSWPGVPCTKVAPLLGEEKDGIQKLFMIMVYYHDRRFNLTKN
jgi:hypothetical protein